MHSRSCGDGRFHSLLGRRSRNKGVAATTGACGGSNRTRSDAAPPVSPCVTGRTGFAGLAGSGAPLAVAAGSTTRSDGKRIPQNPTAGSVNSNPRTRSRCCSFRFHHLANDFFFRFLVREEKKLPAVTPGSGRITAPLPNTSTVCVVSENGSRLLLPSTVRAPFTGNGNLQRHRLYSRLR